ncbi:PfkB family carbohydrate kinase [Poseidonibacter ostreae]|jgi:fructokinase|uniref:Carbohydrate kinase n=1 Tax=Poseidonibacter ostreae TaxID=2654171 RepID=A0A6L4WP34_9BACT|nr:PfkB family carbohydrate kinase [Poseidonibacter ostreae]KAB7885620.1 carbohydrate kinase [Poseidonibacter ostreae]KAB7888275.1 carbohydrate kinase [Poseidonibacter ostreae]KAB7889159.1 carbohydrate kinase [Poseidonibacter ostreae]
MNENKYKDIYIYGEVLFDCFSDKKEILGGAPFNVAWNLQGFGLKPKMITSIGKDDLGTKVLDAMQKWGMDKSHVNILENKKTGLVNVVLDDNGIPEYSIEDDSAYDYINSLKTPNKNSIIYHGSLGLRKEHNQKVCNELKKQLDSNCFVDINLRAPFWNDTLLKEILNKLKWLKINDEELPLVSKALGLNSENENEQLEFILDKLNLELLILTKGSQGALLINKNKKTTQMDIVPVTKMADTVGAGDAFSSVVILGLVKAWDSALTIKRAMGFASKVCSLNGAIVNDKEFYNSVLKEWES